jgi:hypothetical protein
VKVPQARLEAQEQLGRMALQVQQDRKEVQAPQAQLE